MERKSITDINLDNLKFITPEEHIKPYKNCRKQNCNVVSIQEQVKLGYLKFYVKDKYIYCENVITKECVIVGTIDNITIGIDLGQGPDKTFVALDTIDAGSISRTKKGMYF